MVKIMEYFAIHEIIEGVHIDVYKFEKQRVARASAHSITSFTMNIWAQYIYVECSYISPHTSQEEPRESNVYGCLILFKISNNT